MSNVPAMILRVEDLAVDRGRHRVLHGVGFALAPGTVLGVLGANGAGKSTLLRAIGGQLPLAAGRVQVGAHALPDDPTAVKGRIGYAVDPAELPPSLTGRQYLELVGSIRGVAPAAWWDDDLPARLEASAYLDTPLGACSLGTRAKFAILAALLARPPLLILDESLNGLDPVSLWHAKRILQHRVRSEGAALMLATHAIETVAALCDRAIFLDAGRIAFDWDAAALQAARTDLATFEARVMTALLARRGS